MPPTNPLYTPTAYPYPPVGYSSFQPYQQLLIQAPQQMMGPRG